jgi:hypothetical protein
MMYDFFFSVETQARLATKPEDTSVASPDSQVQTVTSPVLNEPTTVGDPAVSRVTSIILQPPAVASTRNVSTPIFMHLGQQVCRLLWCEAGVLHAFSAYFCHI